MLTSVEGRCKLLLGVDADVVDEHLLRELRGAVGGTGPGAAYGDIQ